MKLKPKKKKAIIYCRVSTKKQAREGEGLDSQEARCREFAENNGYEVVAVFPDEASGGGDFMKRPGMVALLAFVSAQPDEKFLVIFDDLKRFARDKKFHQVLRETFNALGAERYCLNHKFEDTIENEFVEDLLSLTNDLERRQNARQVNQKMRAHMQQGRWKLAAPRGYKYEKHPEHGKLITPVEPISSVHKEALDGYAQGRFQNQAEIRRFLELHPDYPKNSKGRVEQQRVTDLLNQPLYAGIIDYPKWGISNVRGKHQALITIETFEKIQERRKGKSLAPARKNINLDFPLRGFVCCSDCGKPYTSCWSKGKNKHYPYYLCDTRGCPSYRKSIRKEVIEGKFVESVKTLQPSTNLIALVSAMFRKAWDQQGERAKHVLTSLKRDLNRLEKELDATLTRMVNLNNDTAISAFENRIDKMERQRMVLTEKITNHGQNNGSFEKSIEHALSFFANPWKLWASGKFEWQRLLLRLAFADRMTYDRNVGYRTPEFALPFKLLTQIDDQNDQMVP